MSPEEQDAVGSSSCCEESTIRRVFYTSRDPGGGATSTVTS